MRSAERLLGSSDAPIQAIARSCGYTNANTLAFKRVHAMTPVQYRRSYRSQASSA
jgi:AraC-like DNA-binding protein